MTTLFAQPYDIMAYGFYFETVEEYNEKANKLINSTGWPVEEFEIQFIEGENIDSELFEALGVDQSNFGAFLEAVENWSNDDKIKIIITAGDAGYSFDLGKDCPNQFDIDLYELDSLRELAIQFVDDGLYGEIPENIQHYLDFDTMARDLGVDYSKIIVDNTNYLYRCD